MERKKYFTLHVYSRTLKGFSLVELMVALALGSLLAAALYTFMSKQNNVYAVQDQTAEMHQNLRGALEKITRDLGMAGFGKPYWSTINNNSGLSFALRLKDAGGNAVTADNTNAVTLEIVGCLDPPVATLASAAAANTTTLTIGNSQGLNFKSGSSLDAYKTDISLDGKESVRIAAVTGTNNETLTIDRDPGTSASDGTVNQGLLFSYFATTTNLYIVKYVTYSVNSAVNPPVLQIDEHQGAGAQALADNISAMTVSKAGSVVTVTLTGRSRNPDRTTGSYVTGQITGKVQVRNPL